MKKNKTVDQIQFYHSWKLLPLLPHSSSSSPPSSWLCSAHTDPPRKPSPGHWRHPRSRQMERRLLRRLKSLASRLHRRSRPGTLPFVKNFTYKEINKATSGFGMIIASGPRGTIYKARFPSGLVAAVKRVRSQQLEKNAFFKNVQLLGRLHHRHLVRLKGFSEGRDRFLVFDYTENGSLKDYLHDPLRTPLNWRTRLQIAIDIAAALEYLQCFCEPPVYSVSVNSNNILLDDNFAAKLSDVGFVDGDFDCNSESDVTCSEDNTEQRNRRLIFQFGVFLLELITGQSLVNETEIVQWIQESGFACSIHKMVDTDLGDNYDSKELESLLIIARLCTRSENDTLISISQILRYLQGHQDHSSL